MNVLDIKPSPSGITVLTAGGPQAWIMINALRDRFGAVSVIREKAVAGHASGGLPLNLATGSAHRRIRELIETHRLAPESANGQQTIDIETLNSIEARAALQATRPRAVFVISARQLNEKTLSAVDCPYLGYNPGIAEPRRRAFGIAKTWPRTFAATVHRIACTHDRGENLYQAYVDVSQSDNMRTYSWVMAAGSRDIVVRAIEDALKDAPGQGREYSSPHPPDGPTLESATWTGIGKHVW